MFSRKKKQSSKYTKDKMKKNLDGVKDSSVQTIAVIYKC